MSSYTDQRAQLLSACLEARRLRAMPQLMKAQDQLLGLRVRSIEKRPPAASIRRAAPARLQRRA